ncbi:MAG: methyltransferase domain-containing protein [Verrucomicrobiota bacterium]|nr:methyltransferase domain-containing protein [Verrucomicrobiota bacterium]
MKNTLKIISSTYEKYEIPTNYRNKKVELDLGCGKGLFLLNLAKLYPDRLILGVDIMLGRLRKLRNKIHLHNLSNAKLLRASAIELIGYQLQDNSIDRIHFLCPDPWPKAAHRSKRVFTSEFCGMLTRVLKNEGILHISTDNKNYLDFMKKSINNSLLYHNYSEGIDDLKDIKTDFEIIWKKEGKKVPHFAYKIKKLK